MNEVFGILTTVLALLFLRFTDHLLTLRMKHVLKFLTHLLFEITWISSLFKLLVVICHTIFYFGFITTLITIFAIGFILPALIPTIITDTIISLIQFIWQKSTAKRQHMINGFTNYFQVIWYKKKQFGAYLSDNHWSQKIIADYKASLRSTSQYFGGLIVNRLVFTSTTNTNDFINAFIGLTSAIPIDKMANKKTIALDELDDLEAEDNLETAPVIPAKSRAERRADLRKKIRFATKKASRSKHQIDLPINIPDISQFTNQLSPQQTDQLNKLFQKMTNTNCTDN